MLVNNRHEKPFWTNLYNRGKIRGNGKVKFSDVEVSRVNWQKYSLEFNWNAILFGLPVALNRARCAIE